MENSAQEHGGEVNNTGSVAGTTVPVEEVNADLSGNSEASASAQDNSVGARYKLKPPAQLPISRSPCILTIPPGLSPTSFLESPVLLSNIKAEPSPTTGSFSLSKIIQGSREAFVVSSAQNHSGLADFHQTKVNGFEFQFDIGPCATTRPPLSMASSGFILKHKESTEDIMRENPRSFAPSSSIKCEFSLPKEVFAPSNLTSSSRILDSDMPNHKAQQNSAIQASFFNNKDTLSSATNDKLSDDGYNWRKYGQKLVKGCEFPRSYYKCTYPNCEVKKIFERSPDGQIKEIVYKGTHEHPKPQSNRRHSGNALISRLEEKVDRDPSLYVGEDNTNGNTQISYMEHSKTPVLSPQQENEDGSDAALQLQCVNDEIDDDDPFSKKRKLDGVIDETFIVKPIREPRVVVQTLSEIDILDDGYRWRKYGQKVVRGNPNPRSYYKCTSGGCSVRKHVERASHDPKAVITTYEGKHNHDVPTARMSSHEQAGAQTMSGIQQRFRSGENDSNSVVNHGVGIGYMQQGVEPIDNSRTWPLNLFRPAFQSIFPVE